MHARTTICAVVLLLAATACAGPGHTDEPDARPKQATAKPVPAAGALKIGVGHHWSDTDTDGSHISGTTTVMGYTQPAKGATLSDDVTDVPHPVWATLDVRLCADATSTTVMASQTPWSLGFPDGTRGRAPLFSGSGVPKPEYPTGSAAVRPGSCLRGKITFAVERGTRPDQVIYDVESRDPVGWAVPAA
ncbi:hypothetical protein AQJ43_32995 [Streptomyces avermitilis]|uniref:Secreted protein n=2 Tax=Streptomyces avermitilis TaxID=33903 RepID=Q82BJ8_STRAW|nr:MULTISPECIES: hypothetical protein [Streptomyces]KUN50371.1 hypothetical protein AQJ43_32995 [Streptomyces avermitilis]MYT01279.1 hypothetical protein [Streptomyces sp. SID5469]OOV30876.1 hypothetical protein SM007_17025 [Streptomyces avermitilis]BAC73419.1 putative secreted protein [Streptomyces avermitilis MA-4680 = NBRC 14893]BBJ53891.1 hypothetical protein SAVMC3_65200 [Streptomyces avermitilis]